MTVQFLMSRGSHWIDKSLFIVLSSHDLSSARAINRIFDSESSREPLSVRLLAHTYANLHFKIDEACVALLSIQNRLVHPFHLSKEINWHRSKAA